MKSYDEKELERTKERIREELKNEGMSDKGMGEINDEILTSMAKDELRRIALIEEDQKYRGWTIYFYKQRVIRTRRLSLIKNLKQRLSNWGDFEEKNDKIDLTDPVYGYDVLVEFGDFVSPSPSNTQYHAKISSSVFAWKRYRNQEHRRVLFDLWEKLFKMPGEAYLDFEGYSKLIKRRLF
jgi:hypothetical protein